MQLISHLKNIQYLCGFEGSNGLLLLGEKENLFFTDFRYKENGLELENNPGRVPVRFVLMDEHFLDTLKTALAGEKSIEFESHHMTVDDLSRWKEKLPDLEWKPIEQRIETLRAQKDEDELAAIRRSQAINEDCLTAVKDLLKPGVTEQAIAWEIKRIGHDLGAEDISFEPIVAFGPHSAVPHHHCTERALKEDDVILIDMGMKWKGYCSDMTRTFLPKSATSEQKAVYQAVLDAQLAGIAAIKAGASAAEVDTAARRSMGDQAQFFGHSFGHGIGLDVHEQPGISHKSKDILLENMVITAEPGIYLEGRFGVRIEDMGRVTKEGYDNFTKMEK